MKYCVLPFCLLLIIGGEFLDTTQETLNPTLVTLKKLREEDGYRSWQAEYDLAEMGHEDAVTFLIKTLADESVDARRRATEFLQFKFPDPRAVPALTEVFSHDEDEYARKQAAYALACIDRKYAADLMVQHLNSDAETQNIAVNLLSELKDKRVIPTLVKRLENFVEEKDGHFRLSENGSLLPEKEALKSISGAAFTLGEFGDKRAAPVLLRILTSKEFDNYYNDDYILNPAVKYLTQFGDERLIPELVKFIGTRIHISEALQKFAPVIVPALVENLKQTDGSTNAGNSIRNAIVTELGKIQHPEVAPIYGKLYLEAVETENHQLRRTMISAISNMGTVGLKILVDIIQDPILRESSNVSEVLYAISSYKTPEAVDAILSLARDKSFPYRLWAIRELAQFEQTFKTEISNNLTEFFNDKNPNVKNVAMHLMHELEIFKSNEAEVVQHLNQLLNDNDLSVKLNALHYLLLYDFLELNDVRVSKNLNQILAEKDSKLKFSVLTLMLQHDLPEAIQLDLFNHLGQLLYDNTPEISSRAIYLIQNMKLNEMKPALQELTSSPDESVRDAVYETLHALSDESPLKLYISLNQQRYDYDEPIELIYHLVNTSPYPIKVLNIPKSNLHRYGLERFLSSYIEIQQPDGNLPNFHSPPGPPVSVSPPWRPNPKDYQTLQPAEEVKGTISLTHLYALYQVGHYSVRMRIPHPAKTPGIYNSTFRLVPKQNISPATELTFDINPPTPDQLEAMFDAIKPPTTEQFKAMFTGNDAKNIKNTRLAKVEKVFRQLGVLQSPETIPALKELVTLDVHYIENIDDISDTVKWGARKVLAKLSVDAMRTLAKFSDPSLIPMWIKELDNGWSDIAISVLVAKGDKRVIKYLRQCVYGGNFSEDRQIYAALDLQQLGDNSGVEWFKKLAKRKLQHWDRSYQEKGFWILKKLNRQYDQDIDREIWKLLYGPAPDILKNWESIYKKLKDIPGLQDLLQHPNPDLQRIAAYKLAQLGDTSGVHLIQADLYAKEQATRRKARETLQRLQKEKNIH